MADKQPNARLTPLAKLRPAPWNPRTIRDDRFKNLCDSIQADPEFIWRRPVLAQADGTIYAGNMRYRAAEHLGMAAVPAIVEDIPDRLAKERALRDNAQWGDWDDGELARLVGELQAAESNLDLLGLEEAELARLLAPAKVELTDPDAVPPVPDEPTTKPGDLWLLGEHRLLCGDAGNKEDHERLLDGNVIDLVLTDPPYGVGIDYGSLTDDSELVVMAIMERALPLIQKWPVALITSGHRLLWRYPEPTWILAWIHPAGMGSGPWGFTCLNPVLAYGADPYLKRRLGRRADALVLANDREGIEGHPVIKPLQVWEWLLERGSPAEGEAILDPFVGSGTTLIACERLGRRCYAIEIEPRYVDVAVRRWEEFTGRKAVLDAAPD